MGKSGCCVVPAPVVRSYRPSLSSIYTRRAMALGSLPRDTCHAVLWVFAGTGDRRYIVLSWANLSVASERHGSTTKYGDLNPRIRDRTSHLPPAYQPHASPASPAFLNGIFTCYYYLLFDSCANHSMTDTRPSEAVFQCRNSWVLIVAAIPIPDSWRSHAPPEVECLISTILSISFNVIQGVDGTGDSRLFVGPRSLLFLGLLYDIAGCTHSSNPLHVDLLTGKDPVLSPASFIPP